MTAGPSLERALQAGGVVAVTAAKAADLALTVAVLPILPGAEVNPVARLAWAAGQEAGLLALAAATVGVVILVTESGVRSVRRLGGSRGERLATRAVGYGLPCLWWLAAAGYNTVQLANAFPRPL
ncbi:MAG: hypothetical protein ABEH66_02905 [Halobacteriales archaeon]